jgi:hypothetical protein
LLAYVLTAFVVRVPWAQALRSTLVPSVSIDPEYLMALIAVLGTTIRPYLFFWQTSQEVEDVPKTGRNRSDRLKPLGARRHTRRDRLGRHRRHSAAELSVCPGPGFSTRSWARSHRATKCHAEVQHLLITSDPFLTPHSQLLAQPLRATHVWIAALIGAPESMYIGGSGRYARFCQCHRFRLPFL